MALPEILAPVGGREQLLAAVRCGADAVYLGTKGFNARRSAENFDSFSLSDTVSYCHARGVAVHVTVNTLVTDGEMSELEKTAEDVAASGADAVIVQDLAVMRYFLSRYPSLPVHASTQCAIHDSDGASFYEDLGVSRVVLARELSIKEIEKIRSRTTVELEAFIHGALCMCLSGACCLSSVIGGRSGNRGMCAQPCRLDFRSEYSNYALSLKDMSHLSHIRELEKAGVCSFKIEGRMKRPEYVAAAVTAARQALAGEKYDADTLRAVFSRSGFTDGYAVGKRDASMFGHRSREDVTAAGSVLPELSRLYAKENPLIGVNASLEISGEASRLTLTAEGKTVSSASDGGIIPESRPTDEELAEKSLSKCGGTQFYLISLKLSNPQELMLPPSVMNALRRDALSKLDAALGETVPHEARGEAPALAPSYAPPEKAALWARFEKASQLFDGGFSRVILPADEIKKAPGLIDRYGETLTCELPPVCFPENEDETRALLIELKERGVSSVFAENAYAVKLGRDLGLKVYGGAGLNILNTRALCEYEKLGLSAATVSFELAMDKIARLGGTLPRGYIAYGRLPLMRVRACPVRSPSGCGGCTGLSHLTDRLGMSFPVLCSKKRFQTLLNSVPLHLGGKKQARCDFKLLYFTIESRDECERAASEIISDVKSAAERTGGLYYRELK